MLPQIFHVLRNNDMHLLDFSSMREGIVGLLLCLLLLIEAEVVLDVRSVDISPSNPFVAEVLKYSIIF